MALLFAHTEADVLAEFAALHVRLAAAGMLRVAWPRKASGFSTDLSEDRPRA